MKSNDMYNSVASKISERIKNSTSVEQLYSIEDSIEIALEDGKISDNQADDLWRELDRKIDKFNDVTDEWDEFYIENQWYVDELAKRFKVAPKDIEIDFANIEIHNPETAEEYEENNGVEVPEGYPLGWCTKEQWDAFVKKQADEEYWFDWADNIYENIDDENMFRLKKPIHDSEEDVDEKEFNEKFDKYVDVPLDCDEFNKIFEEMINYGR